MTNPTLYADLSKIRHNALTISALAHRFGIEVCAVAKGVCAAPEIAKAMLSGGVQALGDSRLLNIERLRDAGIDAHITLLRSPMPSEIADAVRLVDRVLVSDSSVLKPLSAASLAAQKTIEVVLMVDLGDLREGFWPICEKWHKTVVRTNSAGVETLEEAVDAASDLSGLRLMGIGVNLACYGAIIPTPEKMQDLLCIGSRVQRQIGRKLEVISGGNSANIALLMDETMPRNTRASDLIRITELRIGEAILLGTEAVGKSVVPGCHPDAFRFSAEVIEVHCKPSIPIGEQGIDAFGGTPRFVDRGVRRRAIVAAGRQDCDWEDMTPLRSGLRLIGASSDHLVLDVEECADPIKVGDTLDFGVGYSCLLRATTSEYVRKVYV